MTRIALTIFALLLLTTGEAAADRLGGAYRGPVPADAPGGLGVGPGGGRRAAPDVLALWPFYFEHSKESLLEDRIIARRTRLRGTPTEVDPAVIDRILPVLVKALESPASEVRDAAILALGKLGRAEVVPYLAAALKDPDQELREDALLALGLTRHPDAVALLTGALEDFRTQPFAALGLALAEDRTALDKLLEHYQAATRDEDPAAACILATALGRLVAEDEELDALATPLRLGRPSILKNYTCQAVGQVELDRARDWLKRGLCDKNHEVKASAILALGFPKTPSEAKNLLGPIGLKSGHRMCPIFAVHTLSRTLPGSPWESVVREELLDRAEKPAKNMYLAQHAALAMGLAGMKDSNEFFLELMTARTPNRYPDEVQSAMVMALGLTRDTRAKACLEGIVADTKRAPDLRGYAALALAFLGDEESLPALRAALRVETARPDLLRSGSLALGFFGTAEDVPFLLEALARTGDEGRHVRGAAAIALGLIGGEEALTGLLELATAAEAPLTRAFAIAALGWLADRDPVPRIPLLFAGLNYRVGRKDPVVKAVLGSL
jgi:HEAT repeat protein